MSICFHRLVSMMLVALLLVSCTTPAAPTNAPNTPAGAAPTAAVSTSTTAPTKIPPATAAPTVPPTNTPSSPTSAIPLKDALSSLQPQDVFTNFYQITQVPRPSGSMDQIRAFLVQFGQGLELDTIIDDAGNVIIRKPASAGMENRQVVVLQAHMDMVAQKAEGKDFDFTKDPIQAYVSGDYVVADGTTLGADDGSGMAISMSILQSTTLKAGPIEALFTVDEETSLSGANGLKPDTLQGRTLINLDGETEGTFTIGSAGGEDITMNASYKQALAPANMVAYQVKVSGLQGGHSGADIDKGRGHATKLLVRLLKESLKPYGLRIASIEGGTARNAIPTEASAVVFLSDTNVDAFTKQVQDFEATVQSELKATEPDLSVQLQAVQPPAQVMDETFQNTLIDALYGTPQGVLRMSDAVPGLVETSTNLGITTAQDGQLQIFCLARSSVDSELQDAAQMIGSVWELAGYQIEISNTSAAWTPNSNSPILGLMQSTYEELYGQQPEVSATHAGLECGAIAGIYPDMDMISIGPTLENVHTPQERLYIPSVQKVMDLVTTTLGQIPEAQK
jgi:dipeptidase D